MRASDPASTTSVRRCIYCAFQAQKLRIQSRRFQTAAPPLGYSREGRAAHPRIHSRQTHSATPPLEYSRERQDERPHRKFPSRKRQDGSPLPFAFSRRGHAETPANRPVFIRQQSDSFTPLSGQKGSYGVSRPNFLRKGPDAPSQSFRKTRTADAVTFTYGQKSVEFNDDMLREVMNHVKAELDHVPLLAALAKQRDSTADAVFEHLWTSLLSSLKETSTSTYSPEGSSPKPVAKNRRYNEFKKAFDLGGRLALQNRIKFAFYDIAVGSRLAASTAKAQKSLADIRYPTEWYAATRQMNREFHLHVGPTNSGKTYHALKRLESAELGAYAGPLRLLAHEVYSRMNARGIPTILLTGDERRNPPGMEDIEVQPRLFACTVEMLSLNATLDVCVIDEIQLIGDQDRGWAWTQAVLAVKAREVHLCGEERAISLVQELCAMTGDKLHIHHYERLSPLKMADKSLDGDLAKLQKGDCVICFSVLGIHAMREQIERKTRKKCAIVYGSLPPETRAQQARLFNDPNNDYEFLVASDAIGMGLNLAIKRVIFETSLKYDGVKHNILGIPQIKQIGGRAGRYRTAAQVSQTELANQEVSTAKGDPALPSENINLTTSQSAKADQGVSPSTTADVVSQTARDNVGIVTTLDPADFPIVKAAMEAQPPPLTTAGIAPSTDMFDKFATYFPPETPFSYIIMKLYSLCSTHPRFHLCNVRDQLRISDIIEPVRGLSTADRWTMCAAPTFRDPTGTYEKLCAALARAVASQGSGELLDIPELPLAVLDETPNFTRPYLSRLEVLHQSLVLYLWLTYRFAGVFTSQALAFHVKALVEEKIEQVLAKLDLYDIQRQMAARREQRVERLAAEAAAKAANAETEVNEVEQEDEEDEEPAADVAAMAAEIDTLSVEHQTDLMDAAKNKAYGSGQVKKPDGTVFEFETDDLLADGVADMVVKPARDDASQQAHAGEIAPTGEETSLSSFAAWRTLQTSGESQATKEEEDDEAYVRRLRSQTNAEHVSSDVSRERETLASSG